GRYAGQIRGRRWHHSPHSGGTVCLRLVARAQQGWQLAGGHGGTGAVGRASGPLHFLTLFTMNRENIMKAYIGLLRTGLTALLLWCALPALAAELPPLSLADAKAKQAVILDTRASHFYQGWPMEG